MIAWKTGCRSPASQRLREAHRQSRSAAPAPPVLGDQPGIFDGNDGLRSEVHHHKRNLLLGEFAYLGAKDGNDAIVSPSLSIGTVTMVRMPPTSTELTAFGLRAKYEAALLRSTDLERLPGHQSLKRLQLRIRRERRSNPPLLVQALVNEPWCAATGALRLRARTACRSLPGRSASHCPRWP